MSQSLVRPNTIRYITHEDAAELASKIFNIKCLKAIDFRLEPFSTEKLGYLSDQLLLTIQTLEDIDNRQLTHHCTFFAKTLAPDSNAFNQRVFQEENHFYGNFLLRLRNFHIDSWTPQCYLVKKNVIVLENLKSKGFDLAAEKLTTQQLKAAMAAVARFHASSILLEYQLKVPLTSAFPGFFEARKFKNDNGPNSGFLAAGMEVGESIACDLCLDPKYIAMAYSVVTQDNHFTDSEWNAICHQDLWINNMMFSKDNESCRLLDFQTIAYGSFATDVVQMLHLNLDKATRLELENFSLEYYHSVLKETLIHNGILQEKIMSLEKMFEIVEKKRIYGLFSVVHLGPLVYLNKQFAKEYTKEPTLQQSYDLISRKDFIKNVMKSDPDYRRRLEESVKELVEYMGKNKLFK